jgi:hypothetical protein
LGLTIPESILRPFDFYIVVDTSYGVYTVFPNGNLARGITPLYRNVPYLEGPKSMTVYNNITVPAWRPGTYTFYSAAVDAGKVPPVSNLAELTSSTPYVIAFNRAQVFLH